MSTNSPRILRLPQVMDRTSLKKSTIYFLMNAKRFPQNFKISTRAAGWLEDEIDEFVRRTRR